MAFFWILGLGILNSRPSFPPFSEIPPPEIPSSLLPFSEIPPGLQTHILEISKQFFPQNDFKIRGNYGLFWILGLGILNSRPSFPPFSEIPPPEIPPSLLPFSEIPPGL